MSAPQKLEDLYREAKVDLAASAPDVAKWIGKLARARSDLAVADRVLKALEDQLRDARSFVVIHHPAQISLMNTPKMEDFGGPIWNDLSNARHDFGAATERVIASEQVLSILSARARAPRAAIAPAQQQRPAVVQGGRR